MKNSYDIILRPIITEQSMEHADILKYSFEVAPEATKPEIEKAVEEITAKLKSMSIPIKSKKEMAQVGTVASNNDSHLLSLS